jgi:predicted O-linked N-acetylglucosamine transferase (SPINDLY family)
MELLPDSSAVHLSLARILLGKGAFAEADEQIKKCLEYASGDLKELEALLDVFADMECAGAVEPLCRRFLELDPDARWVEGRLVVALELLGCAQEAASLRKRAMEGAERVGREFLICSATMHQSEAPDALLGHACAYGRGLLPENARKLAAGHVFKNRGTNDGRMRVGFVSHEVRGHSVAAFLEPVITRLNRDEFEVCLYSTDPVVDEVSKRLMAGADRFADISALTPLERAKCIRQDNIDLAIDTTGFTRGCHFETFAHRAAPVQVHYIGYFGTSGLERMDYFLGDSLLNRPEDDHVFSEKIWRLPCFWTAWQERFQAPDILWTPAADGSVTLGSCNALYKLGSKCLDLWSEIMLRLPGSRLLLKNRQCSDPTLRANIARTLEHKGIAPGRIEFMLDTPGWHEHMALYDRIDLCLDPLPFNGCTTAFEALWMGVPMIALEGSWMGGRVGMTMLRALGHPEWTAATEEEYIAKAVALAENVDLRRALRVPQREKMRASPLCDYDGVTRALEDAFRRMCGKA